MRRTAHRPRSRRASQRAGPNPPRPTTHPRPLHHPCTTQPPADRPVRTPHSHHPEPSRVATHVTRRDRLGLACPRAEGHVVRVPRRRLQQPAPTPLTAGVAGCRTGPGRNRPARAATARADHVLLHASVLQQARRERPHRPRRRSSSGSSWRDFWELGCALTSQGADEWARAQARGVRSQAAGRRCHEAAPAAAGPRRT